jgi:hypothetical protein
MPSNVPFGHIPSTLRKPGLYQEVGGAKDQPIQLADIPMMTRRGHAIVYWTPVSEGGLDDDITVLMALSDNEVWPGYRSNGQWFFITSDPCSETPTHWADLPRHPMDTAP